MSPSVAHCAAFAAALVALVLFSRLLRHSRRSLPPIVVLHVPEGGVRSAVLTVSSCQPARVVVHGPGAWRLASRAPCEVVQEVPPLPRQALVVAVAAGTVFRGAWAEALAEGLADARALAGGAHRVALSGRTPKATRDPALFACVRHGKVTWHPFAHPAAQPYATSLFHEDLVATYGDALWREFGLPWGGLRTSSGLDWGHAAQAQGWHIFTPPGTLRCARLLSLPPSEPPPPPPRSKRSRRLPPGAVVGFHSSQPPFPRERLDKHGSLDG
jgi:hypothetical protein